MATAKYFVIGCIIVLVLAVVLVVIVVGGIFYLGLGKHIEDVEAEGVEFGRKTDQQGCQDEAIRRLKSARRSGDLIRAQDAQMFIYGCFQTCRPTSGFCSDAPKEDSFSPCGNGPRIVAGLRGRRMATGPASTCLWKCRTLV